MYMESFADEEMALLVALQSLRVKCEQYEGKRSIVSESLNNIHKHHCSAGLMKRNCVELKQTRKQAWILNKMHSGTLKLKRTAPQPQPRVIMNFDVGQDLPLERVNF